MTKDKIINANLQKAKTAKKDEFYTRIEDIEKEMYSYLAYDNNVFRDKTILLPCDDPETSNFTKFFVEHFTELGIKKLISTSYIKEKNDLTNKEINKNVQHGKILTIDKNNFNNVNNGKIESFRWSYLKGDGDFRSEEVTRFRDESDIVITNPPFSLFREFVTWLREGGVKFSIIGNMNAISYKEIFPLIQSGNIWLGAGGISGIKFSVPQNFSAKNYSSNFQDEKTKLVKFGNVCWFTNIEHGKNYEPLQLHTMKENLKHNKQIIKNPNSYKKYDNYDAIEIPVVSGIPSDYDGVMGVPISFLGKHCPQQFQIVGITDRQNSSGLQTRKYTKEDSHSYNDLNARSVIRNDDGSYQKVYARLLIKRKR